MVPVPGDPVGPEGEDGVRRDLGDDRGELADRVLLSRSGLTRLADRLEREGLLTREAGVYWRTGGYVDV